MSPVLNQTVTLLTFVARWRKWSVSCRQITLLYLRAHNVLPLHTVSFSVWHGFSVWGSEITHGKPKNKLWRNKNLLFLKKELNGPQRLLPSPMMAVSKPHIMITASMGAVGLNLTAQIRDCKELQKTTLWWSLFPCNLLAWVTFTYFRHLIEAKKYLGSAFLWSQQKEIGSCPRQIKAFQLLSLLLSSMRVWYPGLSKHYREEKRLQVLQDVVITLPTTACEYPCFCTKRHPPRKAFDLHFLSDML